MLNLFKFLMFCAMDLLNVTEDSSLCNSTPMNLMIARDRLHLEREERVIARPRQDRLDDVYMCQLAS